MRFLCNHCDAGLAAEHCWAGLTITCPNCGKPTELKYRLGQPIPWMQCDVTFSEFKQLLTNTAYLEKIDPLVMELLGCSLERTELGVKLTAQDGSFIPFEVAHLKIQLDPKSQARLYNTAMDMWR